MHTRQHFDQQLAQLEQDIVRMGTVVEEMLDKAIRALVERDVDLAVEVINEDDLADSLDLNIEQRCMRLLALQQPMSKDLRTIGSILKAITDLERIGDFSVDIARATQRIAEQPDYKQIVDVPQMAAKVKEMVRHTLKAFVERDLEAVMRICTEEDDVVDHFQNTLMTELIEVMQEDPRVVPQAAHFLLIVRYLERIADHCTNVAERVYYMETGRLEELA
jgi:phosphate transport system protein